MARAMLLIAIASVAVVASLSASPVLASSCGVNGLDFSSLTKQASPDWTVSDGQANGYTYSINVCAAINDATQAQCEAAQGSICQYQTSTPTSLEAVVAVYAANAATWTHTPASPGVAESAMVSYSNGQACYPTMQPRTSSITFTCAAKQGSWQVLSTTQGCAYNFALPTPLACSGNAHGNGGGHKLSGGWVFIIILCVVAPLYVVAGCLWNRHKQNRDGGEPGGIMSLCPNVDFWRSLPGLVKDGCKFTGRAVGNCFGRVSGRGSSGDSYESFN